MVRYLDRRRALAPHLSPTSDRQQTAVVTVSLPVPMAKQIERIRKAAHRTRSEVVREALRYYFHAQPDIEEAGRQAYLDAKAGKGLSPIFETVEEGKRWIAAQHRKARRRASR